MLSTPLLQSISINRCHIIRAHTNRPGISYNVSVSSTDKQAQNLLVNAVLDRLKTSDPNFRCLVYCRKRSDVDKIAKLLGCKPFHAKVSESDRKTSYEDWVSGKEQVLVCSSLLGCGIDVSGVQVVYHFQTPWSILDFAQESGRAGRGGEKVESHVFASKEEEEEHPDEDQFGKKLMRDWVLQVSTCRRIALSSFLDGLAISCILLQNGSLCDVCRQKRSEGHPGCPTKLIPPPMSSKDYPIIKPLPLIPSSAKYTKERIDYQE